MTPSATPPEPAGPADLDRFYALLGRLRGQQGGDHLLGKSACRDGWPDRGIYFFFEPGECRAGGDGLRVVRVGTHAVSRASKVTLWKRLSVHKGTPSGGRHRRSDLREHVGAALLARGGFPPAIAETWGRGSEPVSEAVRAAERPLEQAAGAYIGAMPFLVLAADDEPGTFSTRGYLAWNAIGLLSTVGRATDPPSPGWLGRDCPHPAVRASGLWNVDHVGKRYDPAFLDRLAALIEAGQPADA